MHRNDFASTSNAFPEAGESSNATPHKIAETRSFLGIASLIRFPPPSRRRDQLVRRRIIGAHLIRDRCERLSRPRNVSSATPRVPAPASPRPTSKKHRNKQVPTLAAGASSRVLARRVAAQQPDRRSAAETLPELAPGRKSQPG